MKKKIYIKDWLTLKPYDSPTSIDIYYLKISNAVKQAVTKSDSLLLYKYIDEEEINLMACFITSYFEDLISETNIWNAFISKHQELYGKKLPFFDTETYYENEVNIEDIAFLIWYFINTVQQVAFVSPYNDFIQNIAFNVGEVLEEAYEYAPENEKLKSFYTLPVTDDYYRVRLFLDQILTKTYLFLTDTSFRLLEQEIEIAENSEDGHDITLQYLRENRDQFVFKEATKLLGLQAKEWAALILGTEHPMSADIMKLSPRVNGLFLYKGQNNDVIHLEHIATGVTFNLIKESYDYHSDLKEIDSILFIGMVNWRAQWWFSGISSQRPFDADVVLDEKGSLESRMVVDILDIKKNELKYKEIVEQQQKAFINYNEGSPIHFLNSSEINQYLQGYHDFYNQSLQLKKHQREEAMKRARKEGLFLNKDEKDVVIKEDEQAAIFFNPISGLEISIGISSAFPTKQNPFYNEAESKDHFWALISSQQYSKELVQFCVENYKGKISFFKSKTNNLYKKDLDFLLRFFKHRNYFSKYNLVLSGK